MSNAVRKAQALLYRGEIARAATYLKQAESSGDASAARELGLWCLAGQAFRRDLTASRSYFERAAELGDRKSASILRAFVAAGIGAPRDWGLAMHMLRAAAPVDLEAAAQSALIGSMDLDFTGTPRLSFEAQLLSEDPSVQLFPRLFSQAECAYLVGVSAPALRPSVVVDPDTGRQVPNPIRTSSATSFPFIDENPAIHALNRRLAAASGTDVRSGEPLQVLHYALGQEYRQHSDALPLIAPDQQRVLTFLVYLNDDYDGGETRFPAANLNVRGRTGDGLLFRNVARSGEPDQRSVHAGLPVTRGVKHLASRWIRATPLKL
ncbi:MAG TPA: 2OG-Fe(II) oxygenase [Sphingomicrobium sp.]|nr:2OG-Fe(II) oxygenase [Sphingomicrobium sp.]